jgi:hypothetical protein
MIFLTVKDILSFSDLEVPCISTKINRMTRRFNSKTLKIADPDLDTGK